ncbi:MAG: hypothetical protein AB9903_30775 [Vulcanimicrobiota bacterium]
MADKEILISAPESSLDACERAISGLKNRSGGNFHDEGYGIRAFSKGSEPIEYVRDGCRRG